MVEKTPPPPQAPHLVHLSIKEPEYFKVGATAQEVAEDAEARLSQDGVDPSPPQRGRAKQRVAPTPVPSGATFPKAQAVVEQANRLMADPNGFKPQEVIALAARYVLTETRFPTTNDRVTVLVEVAKLLVQSAQSVNDPTKTSYMEAAALLVAKAISLSPYEKNTWQLFNKIDELSSGNASHLCQLVRIGFGLVPGQNLKTLSCFTKPQKKELEGLMRDAAPADLIDRDFDLMDDRVMFGNEYNSKAPIPGGPHHVIEYTAALARQAVVSMTKGLFVAERNYSEKVAQRKVEVSQQLPEVTYRPACELQDLVRDAADPKYNVYERAAKLDLVSKRIEQLYDDELDTYLLSKQQRTSKEALDMLTVCGEALDLAIENTHYVHYEMVWLIVLIVLSAFFPPFLLDLLVFITESSEHIAARRLRDKLMKVRGAQHQDKRFNAITRDLARVLNEDNIVPTKAQLKTSLSKAGIKEPSLDRLASFVSRAIQYEQASNKDIQDHLDYRQEKAIWEMIKSDAESLNDMRRYPASDFTNNIMSTLTTENPIHRTRQRLALQVGEDILFIGTFFDPRRGPKASDRRTSKLKQQYRLVLDKLREIEKYSKDNSTPWFNSDYYKDFIVLHAILSVMTNKQEQLLGVGVQAKTLIKKDDLERLFPNHAVDFEFAIS